MKVRNSKTKQLLEYLALGTGVIVVSILAPQLPYQLLKAYLKNRKFQRNAFLLDLKRLQNRKLIDYQIFKDGSVKICLKKQGKLKSLHYKLDDLKIEKPKIWDKKWRLIIFDIPNRKKAARDALRFKLKNLGFYQLQESVFIHPFPCEDEIEFIASMFDIRKYILIMYVHSFEGEEKLKHHFGIN